MPAPVCRIFGARSGRRRRGHQPVDRGSSVLTDLLFGSLDLFGVTAPRGQAGWKSGSFQLPSKAGSVGP
jgi:hypothetical protein